MKLTVIGGGGVRSMFLAKSLAQSAKRLGITTLSFMDNDPEKLRIFGAMAKKIALLIEPELQFECTTDAVLALTDADYVITTIRVGGDDMRVRDERIALNLGLLGQETTGAAGLSFAHPGDLFLTQNETACTEEAIRLAKEKKMVVALNPSPFDERILALPLDLVDIFLVNEGEAAALAGMRPGAEPGAALVALRIKYRHAKFVLTLGDKGVISSSPESPAPVTLPARKVEAVDTTAAGDTFTGYYLAALSRGLPEREALERATAAAAISVTRRGAAPSVSDPRDVGV